jgi:hypothetical protein
VLRTCARQGAAERSTNTGVATKGPRHQRSHRRGVRGEIPVARWSAPAAVIASAMTFAMITAATT